MSASSGVDRFLLLNAVGEVADAPRLLGEAVQRLLDIIVPTFADVATIDVSSATGEMRRLGARVGGPGEEPLEQALLRRHQSGDAGIGVLRTLATGEAQLLSPVTDETLRRIATGEQDLATFRHLGLRSTIYVPLAARGRSLGVLACSTRDGRPPFDEDDLRFAEALGNRIGLALDNAGLSETVTGLERRLEATLANLAAGVVVRDAEGAVVIANRAAAELLGAESVEQLFALTPGQLMDLFDAYDERGRRLARDEMPALRALRGERPPPVVMRTVLRRTGVARWIQYKARPVFDADGSLSIVVNVLEDITEEKRAELAQRLLAEAGRALASSLDYEQTLQQVARLAVPELADWCGVSILDGEALEQVAVAHVDPRKVALVRRWGQRAPNRLQQRSVAAEVMQTGRPRLIREITQEVLDASVASEEQLRLVRELGMRSIVVVPLSIPGRDPFGTLSLVMAESGRLFDREDLAVAEELARRAATAVENARLYTERSRIAATLQRGLLPPELPKLPGFALASLYRPAGEQVEVGGDFYDAFPIAGGWVIVVGDVAGHGAEAAALTALSRHTLRTAARLLVDPVAVVEQLNVALREREQLSLVSVCVAVLRTEQEAATADVLLAGHPPACHVSGGRLTHVGETAPLLGIDEVGSWRTTRVPLAPGDLLVLYTDGVIDTFGRSGRFGEERLAAALGGAQGAADAIERVELALGEFAQGPQRDDTAVLAVEREHPS